MRLPQAGVVWTYPRVCAPLDDVRIEFVWDELDGQEAVSYTHLTLPTN